MRIPDAMLVNEHLRLEVDFDLEGHGRWNAEINLFIYRKEALRRDRAKASWMTENIRRIEKGQRMLPSPVPPDGWNIDDGYPD